MFGGTPTICQCLLCDWTYLQRGIFDLLPWSISLGPRVLALREGKGLEGALAIPNVGFHTFSLFSVHALPFPLSTAWHPI